MRDDEPEEFNGRLLEDTLCCLKIEIVVLQALKNTSDCVTVLLHRSREDQNVVHVHDNDTFHDQVLEDLVHHCLESRRGVSETEEHDEGFEKAAIGTKRCLPLVTFLDPDVLITPADIDLREDSCVLEFVDDFADERERVRVLDRAGVKVSIMLDRLQTAILFF